MNNISEEIKQVFSQGSILTRLLCINVLVWIGIKIIMLILFLFNADIGTATSVIRWFSVPASLASLLFKPWTLISYMFLHEDFWHIFFNMLWLYWFGKIFLEYLDGKKMLVVYLLGGIMGASLYIISFNLFPVFSAIKDVSYALGASASVLAITIAISTYVPNYSIHLMFLGPVRIKYIALFAVVQDLLSIQNENAGGHIAHLGGALLGYYFIVQLKKGNDISKPLIGLINTIQGYFVKEGSNLKVSHSNRGYTTRNKSDEEFNYEKKQRQHQMDEILDKISKSGYESLSKEEKDLLFKISNKK